MIVMMVTWCTLSGSLHLTPLQDVLQLRPSLSYLDKADIGVHKTEAAANTATNSGGDTTESEGEDAKLVTVRFSKPDGMGRSQKKVGHRNTFTEVNENRKSSQAWSRAGFFGADSEEADEERRLLLASKEDQSGTFDLLEEQYLNLIFPHEVGRREEVERGNGAPSGVLSLEKIKQFPLKRQARENSCHSTVVDCAALINEICCFVILHVWLVNFIKNTPMSWVSLFCTAVVQYPLSPQKGSNGSWGGGGGGVGIYFYSSIYNNPSL